MALSRTGVASLAVLAATLVFAVVLGLVLALGEKREPSENCAAGRDPDARYVKAPAIELGLGVGPPNPQVGGRTYNYQWKEGWRVVRFRLPAGHVFAVQRYHGEPSQPDEDGGNGIVMTLIDSAWNESWVVIGSRTGEEKYRWIDESHEGCNAVFDELVGTIVVRDQ